MTAVALAASVVGIALPVVPAEAATTTLLIAPAADAHVVTSAATTNYGAATTLNVDTSPETETLLRFDVAGGTGAVTRAVLRLYVTNASADAPKVYATTGEWDESTVTWATRPARAGAAVADVGAVLAKEWVEYDLSAVITTRGAYSLGLVGDSSDQVSFTSRNSASTTRRPQLVVTLDDSAPSTSLDAAPAALTSSRRASFSFSSTDATATFECALDGAAFEACSSPRELTDLVDGSHGFQVRARSAAGTVDPTPASHTWTVDATAPTVSGVSPKSGATRVPVSAPVTAVFSESMNAATIDAAALRLVQTDSGTPVPSTVSYDGTTRTASLDPADELAPGTSYTASMPAGAAADLAGNPLAETVSWSFTAAPADTAPPTVRATDPAHGAVGSAVSANVTVTFSEAMSPSTITAETFVVQPSDGGAAVPAGVTYDVATHTAVLDPSSDLAFSTQYTARVTGGAGGVADAAGNPLVGAHSWTFTTLTDSMRLSPDADASVQSGTPGTNYGTATSLVADTSPAAESLIRFDVSGGTGAITRAVLRLYVRDATDNGPKVHAADSAWDESAVTWSSAPSRTGGAVADAGALTTSSWVEYDVSSMVTSRGTYTFNLVPDSSDQVAFTSRNSTATTQRPQLIVDLNATVPGTRLDAAPPSLTTSPDASFAFSSTDSTATFECAQDGPTFAPCTSPRKYAGLAEGSHTFRVRARNATGATDPTPATHTWTIDTVAPAITYVTPAQDSQAVPATSNVTVTFSETVNPATLASGFSLTAEGSSAVVAAAVTYDDESQLATLNPEAALIEGVLYTAQVATTVRDPAGNALAAPRTWSFRIAKSQSSTAVATADAKVESGFPTTNYGTLTSIKADSSPQIESYLRFDVAGYPAGLTSATLRLYVTDGTDNGPALHAADGAWTESGITWADRPARGALVSNAGSLTTGTYVDYDVQAHVRGNGTYNFALVGETSNSVSFASREATASRRPQLLLAHDPAGMAVAATPTSGTYASRQSVTLTASETSRIWFSTDGTDPSDPASHTRYEYSGPLDIAVTTPLKFVAVAPDGRMSAVRTENYTINVTTGHRDFYYGGTGVTEATADKTESKLWQHDGHWWGSLYNNSAGEYRIHRFDGHGWVDTGTLIDTRENSRADVLSDGNTLYVLSGTAVVSEFSSKPTADALAAGSGDLKRYTYLAALQQYVLDPGFPVTVRPGSSESMTLTKDASGRLWMTFTRDGQVWVSHSMSSDLEWSKPFVPAVAGVALHHDDISTIVSVGADKVGLMWSNQVDKKFYFAVHRNSDPGNVWQPSEVAHGGGVAGCGSASSGGTGCANDHLNVKTTADGRVFAAIKTANRTTGQPLVRLVVRGSQGGWTGHTSSLVEDEQSRPRVLIDETNGWLYLLATKPELGGAIFYKRTSLDSISFAPGIGTSLIQSPSDRQVNNATSTKQNISGGFLVLASDSNSKYYLHNLLGG